MRCTVGIDRQIVRWGARQLRTAGDSRWLKVPRYGFDCTNSSLVNERRMSLLSSNIRVVFVCGWARVIPEIDCLNLLVTDLR